MEDYRIENLEKRVDGMEERERINSSLLTKLNTLIETLIDQNKQQNIRNEQMTTTLVKINDNLNNLNQDVKVLKDSDDKNKLDMRDVQKEKITKILYPLGIICGFLTAVASIYLSLKK